ncbi:hypothetical protein [Ovoidimarina sediminis]|uniref:hypothetical protein n=1 Tax=Ovoidimarina sediminis TaxID=3079856 RepID=UPI00290E320C|nr:hypothetical protein [Rhodophyticola sp. MJ-SS7]MDU8944608.1 hypothetical protein [Rhodophyticola sp. MJ-SS7]
MRRAALALLLPGLGLPAAAQTPDLPTAVAAHWRTFSTYCGTALSDPQGYLNTHPATGPMGEQLVSTSPDGQVVVAFRVENGVSFRVELLGLPGRLAVLCEASGLWGFPRSFGQHAEAAEMHSMHESNEGPGIPANLVSAEARKVFEALPDTFVAGGLMPDGVPASQLHLIDPAFATHILGVQTPLAGRQVFVWAGSQGDGLELVSLNYIEAGN